MKKVIILSFLALMLVLNVNSANAADISSKLKGKILLQVEENGEAWYLNPVNNKMYYLGRPADAFGIMRSLGLGVSNKDFYTFNGVAPKKLAGRILLKIEDKGEAYYVHPDSLKMYYLGRPADAFDVMRNLGLGISNEDLNKLEQSEGLSVFTDKNLGFELEYPSSWVGDLKIEMDENSISFYMPAYSNINRPELGKVDGLVFYIVKEKISEWENKVVAKGEEITRDNEYVYVEGPFFEHTDFVMSPSPRNKTDMILSTFKILK